VSAALTELVANDPDEDYVPEADKATTAGQSIPPGLTRDKAKAKGKGDGKPGPGRAKKSNGPKPPAKSGTPGRKGGLSHSREEKGKATGARRSKELGRNKGPGRGTKPPQGRGGLTKQKNLTKGVPRNVPEGVAHRKGVSDMAMKQAAKRQAELGQDSQGRPLKKAAKAAAKKKDGGKKAGDKRGKSKKGMTEGKSQMAWAEVKSAHYVAASGGSGAALESDMSDIEMYLEKALRLAGQRPL
jgi:hypothetical protein